MFNFGVRLVRVIRGVFEK